MMARDEGITSAASIVERITSGDKSAETELVSTYYRGLFFILNRQTQNPTLAEDIAQDTFIVVIQKARNNEITNPSALKAFIRQTGVNLLIGHIRKETRRDTHGAEDIEIHAPTDEIDISRALYSDKLLSITTQLIEELKTSRDRELLRSYFVYDKNKQQICDDLELSTEHFDRVLFRARQRLKQLIQHKLGTATENKSPSASTLLTVGILLGLFTSGADQSTTEKLFVNKVRDIQLSSHLVNITPKTDSRYLPKSLLGKQLTSIRRSV